MQKREDPDERFMGMNREVRGPATKQYAVDVGDIEIFLNLQPGNRPRRLTVLRQFFRFARTHRLVLVGPTGGSGSQAVQGISR